MDDSISSPDSSDKPEDRSERRSEGNNSLKPSGRSNATLRDVMRELAEDCDQSEFEEGPSTTALHRAQASAAKNTTSEQWKAHIKKWFGPHPD